MGWWCQHVTMQICVLDLSDISEGGKGVIWSASPLNPSLLGDVSTFPSKISTDPSLSGTLVIKYIDGATQKTPFMRGGRESCSRSRRQKWFSHTDKQCFIREAKSSFMNASTTFHFEFYSSGVFQ